MLAFLSPSAPLPARRGSGAGFTKSSISRPMRTRAAPPRSKRRTPCVCTAAAAADASDAERDASDDAELAAALRDMGSVRQLLALVGLRKHARPDIGLSLLRGSGALESTVPRVRIAALDCLSRLGGPSDADLLVSVLRGDSDHSVRAAAAGALATLRLARGAEAQPRAAATGALRAAATGDTHFIVRYAAVVALGNVADADAVPLLAALAGDVRAPPLEAAAAVDALGEALCAGAMPAADSAAGLPDPRFVRVVVKRAGDRDELMRAAVARTLGRWRGAAGVEDVLQRMVDDERKYGQSAMVEAVLGDVMEGRLPPLGN